MVHPSAPARFGTPESLCTPSTSTVCSGDQPFGQRSSAAVAGCAPPATADVAASARAARSALFIESPLSVEDVEVDGVRHGHIAGVVRVQVITAVVRRVEPLGVG